LSQHSEFVGGRFVEKYIAVLPRQLEYAFAALGKLLRAAKILDSILVFKLGSMFLEMI